jgi:hypothetical protein
MPIRKQKSSPYAERGKVNAATTIHRRPVGTRIRDPDTDSDATQDSEGDRQLAKYQADRENKRVYARARMQPPTGVWRRRTAMHAGHPGDRPPLQPCIRCNGSAVRIGYKTCDECRLRRDCRACLRRGVVSNEWSLCRNMCMECCRRRLTVLEPEPDGLWDLSFRSEPIIPLTATSSVALSQSQPVWDFLCCPHFASVGALPSRYGIGWQTKGASKNTNVLVLSCNCFVIPDWMSEQTIGCPLLGETASA